MKPARELDRRGQHLIKTERLTEHPARSVMRQASQLGAELGFQSAQKSGFRKLLCIVRIQKGLLGPLIYLTLPLGVSR